MVDKTTDDTYLQIFIQMINTCHNDINLYQKILMNIMILLILIMKMTHTIMEVPIICILI